MQGVSELQEERERGNGKTNNNSRSTCQPCFFFNLKCKSVTLKQISLCQCLHVMHRIKAIHNSCLQILLIIMLLLTSLYFNLSSVCPQSASVFHCLKWECQIATWEPSAAEILIILLCDVCGNPTETCCVIAEKTYTHMSTNAP